MEERVVDESPKAIGPESVVVEPPSLRRKAYKSACKRGPRLLLECYRWYSGPVTSARPSGQNTVYKGAIL